MQLGSTIFTARFRASKFPVSQRASARSWSTSIRFISTFSVAKLVPKEGPVTPWRR